MSWLNNSLNTIKGQLSTLAQEVLSDGAASGDEEYRGPVDNKTAIELLADTEKEKEELYSICTQKDNEISLLRKQIAVLQNKICDSGGGSESTSSASKGKTAKSSNDDSSKLEDSWCWEPDNAKQDTDHSSESSSGNGNEMVNITLEEVSLGATSKTRKLGQQKTPDLQQRVLQLEAENKDLNTALEELDSQHNLAIQNVLELKTDLQEKLNAVTKNYEALKKEHADKFINGELELGKLKKNIEKLETANNEIELERTYVISKNEEYVQKLKKSDEDMADLQALLEKKNQDNIELIQKVKLANKEADVSQEQRTELLQRIEQLLKEVEDLKSTKEKKTSESSASSMGKQSEDEFIVVGKSDENSSDTTTPPTKEDLKDKIVQLENRVSELSMENDSLVLKLQDREMEKDLANNVCKESLNALQQKCEEQQEIIKMWEIQQTEMQEKIDSLKEIAAEAVIAQEQLKIVKDEKIKLTTELSEMKESLHAIEELKQRLILSENEKETLQIELQTLRTAQKCTTELECKIQQLTLQNQQLTLNAEAETETLNNSAELEEKIKTLTAANESMRTELESLEQAKFLQVNAEKKQEITDLDAEEDDEESFKLEKVRDLLNAYVKEELSAGTEESIEKAYKMLRERLWKIDTLEKNLALMSEEVIDLQDTKLVWDHEKKTLEADISQYILQCDELMKNNEILLNELENYKRNKLETISENNEENILQLESELEECTKLNQTLEKEYIEMHDKIDTLEIEKAELSEKLSTTHTTIEELTVQVKDLELQVEKYEIEKSNLIFEMNELWSADGNGQQKDDGKLLQQAESKCDKLEIQLSKLSKDHGDLVATLQAEKTALAEANRRREETDKELNDLKIMVQEQEMRDIEKSKEELEKAQLESNAAESKHNTDDLIRIAQLEADLLATADLQKTIQTLNYEKDEMIKALQQKHAENTQYYMEIQRLQPIVQQLQQELHLANTETKLCEKCIAAETVIADLKKEQEKWQDQVNFLKEKSDILTTNLLTEQTNQKLVQQEKSDVEEQNAAIRKDLERLRQHLLEIEDMHTQETVELQREVEETKAKMVALEDEVSKSSNAYTSASIRANQHAETLQAQYTLVIQQRDELVTKLSLAEDRESKNQAALCNLQCALEQFQNEKENEIKTATLRIRKELQTEMDKQTKLETEMAALNQQLAAANEGLRAAARLSDQLEACQQTIAVLREEVETMKDQNLALEEKLNSSESSQTDKIEKSLIKSLLIGYVVSGNANDKNQVLRLISTLLDFTQIEADKVGLNKQQSSWLGTLLGGANNQQGAHSNENLVQAFVQFLEKESQPKADQSNLPNLLNITQAQHAPNLTSASPNEATRRISNSSNSGTTPAPIPIQPLIINSTILDEFAPNRNSSSILKDILSDT